MTAIRGPAGNEWLESISTSRARTSSTPSEVCQFSTCQVRTTIRWRGYAGISKGNGTREVIQTEKWLCMSDNQRIVRAQARALPISLTPDGYVWVDNLIEIAMGLDV